MTLAPRALEHCNANQVPSLRYEPELVVRDLDMDLLAEVRNRWAFYRDRRPDAYGDLTRA